MKKELLSFLLFITAISNAQIVDIPDAEFKEYLLSTTLAKDSEGNNIPSIDSNDDNEIQVSEASIVWSLYIPNTLDVTSFEGIEAFYNLRDLEITADIESFDAQSLTNLERLYVSGVITSGNIWVQNLENLETLELWGGDYITQIDFTGLTSLKVLGIAYPYQLDVDFSNVPNIEEVYFVNCHLLNDLDLSEAEHLKILNLNSQSLLGNIVLGDKPELTTFSAEISIQSLDLSGCPSLNDLNLLYFNSMNNTPRYLNLKNGVSSYNSLNIELYATIEKQLYVCIDEGNESLFSDTVLNDPNVYISSYCNFTLGGDYNTITGAITHDADDNGCDAADIAIENFRVDITTENEEDFAVFSNNSGEYNFYWGEGTFNLTPSFENSDWFTITPSSATVTFEDDNNNIEIQNFCVTANGEHPDVEVVIAPIVPAQPGFNASYKVTYRNKGNQTLSGGVLLTYDDTVLDYVSSTSGVSVAENTFGWSYTDLQPFETRVINLTLNVNSPAETPAVNIDDVLTFTATIYPDTDDETPSDNTFTLDQTVVGSYDPNDITCLEGETVHMSKIGEYLHYNINFENTGTAPATFVVVKDVINEEQFDISTLQLMYASHDVQTKIEGNQVEFYFGEINLAANGGKGNVLFKIKTLETLQAEDIVTQQANIFFDYNLPIVTNEATTTFTTLNNTVFIKDNTVKLYPNPTADNVTISAKGMVKSVALYDIQGRLLQANIINDTQTTINLSAQPSGLYFVKVITEEGSVVEKLVKQ